MPCGRGRPRSQQLRARVNPGDTRIGFLAKSATSLKDACNCSQNRRVLALDFKTTAPSSAANFSESEGVLIGSTTIYQ
jgi:hypothetical protein